MANSKSKRSQKQFTRIYGLKVAKSVYTRTIRGKYKSGYDPLIKNMLKYNEAKIKKAGWISGEALFKEMRSTFKEDKTPDTVENVLDFVRKAMNTISGTSKEAIFRHNIGAILMESWNDTELTAFLGANNITKEELPYFFNDWTWNSSYKRWEGPNGQWLKIEELDPDEYKNCEISYEVPA